MPTPLSERIIEETINIGNSIKEVGSEIREVGSEIRELGSEIRELGLEIERQRKEIREFQNEMLLSSVKIKLAKVALHILNYNNNRDDILCSKNDIVKIGILSMTKNEFKMKYFKMCQISGCNNPPSYVKLKNLVKDSIRTIVKTDFSFIHRDSIIIFAKEIIENYEDVMNYV